MWCLNPRKMEEKIKCMALSAAVLPQTAFPGTQDPAPPEGPGSPSRCASMAERPRVGVSRPDLSRQARAEAGAGPLLHVKGDVTFKLKVSFFLPGVQANNRDLIYFV